VHSLAHTAQTTSIRHRRPGLHQCLELDYFHSKVSICCVPISGAPATRPERPLTSTPLTWVLDQLSVTPPHADIISRPHNYARHCQVPNYVIDKTWLPCSAFADFWR